MQYHPMINLSAFIYFNRFSIEIDEQFYKLFCMKYRAYHGICLVYAHDLLHKIICYENNQIHGDNIQFYLDGQIYSIERQRNNKKYGMAISYYFTNQIAEVTRWVAGTLDKFHIKYHPTGYIILSNNVICKN